MKYNLRNKYSTVHTIFNSSFDQIWSPTGSVYTVLEYVFRLMLIIHMIPADRQRVRGIGGGGGGPVAPLSQLVASVRAKTPVPSFVFADVPSVARFAAQCFPCIFVVSWISHQLFQNYFCDLQSVLFLS